MKIFRLYFALAALLMILTAAVGGIIEAENNTRRVAFGDDGALPVVMIEEIFKPTDR